MDFNILIHAVEVTFIIILGILNIIQKRKLEILKKNNEIELVQIRNKLEKSLYDHKFQFNKEYDFLIELWKKIAKLKKEIILLLKKSFKGKYLSVKLKRKKRISASRLYDSLNDFIDINKTKVTKTFFQKLQSKLNKMMKSFEYVISKDEREKEAEKKGKVFEFDAKKVETDIINLTEDICETIRERILKK